MAWAVVLLGISVGLLWLGMVGRRVGDHPVCRRCGFDLYGKPAESRVCSECGADLGRRRAVRIGHRFRRRSVIAVAALLLVFSSGWLGLIGRRAAAQVNWIGYEPAFVVVRQAESRSPARRDAALLELLRRLQNGKLSGGMTNQVVRRALALQAEASAPWSLLWGEFLERARDRGRVTNAQWEQYWRRVFTLSLLADAGPAQPLAVRIDCATAGARYSEAALRIEYHATSLSIGAIECKPNVLGGVTMAGASPARFTLGIATEYESYLTARRGTPFWTGAPANGLVPMAQSRTSPAPGGLTMAHASVVVSIVRFRDFHGPRNIIQLSTDVTGPASLSPGWLPVQMVSSPSLEPDVLRSLRVERVELLPAGPEPHAYLAQFRVGGGAMPIDGCFDVELHQQGAKFGWSMGTLECRRGELCLFEFRHQIVGYPNGLAEVVFKPSAEKAALVGMERIWGKTVVVRVPFVGTTLQTGL